MSRGTPSTWVPCTGCSSQEGFPRTRKCRRCASRIKFRFTPQMDDEVRKVWAAAKGNRAALSPAKKDLAVRLGVSTAMLNARAGKLGVTRDTRKPWTKAEDTKLAMLAGLYSLPVMARKMRRTEASIANRLRVMQISRELVTGYTRNSLERLFGAPYATISSWVNRGWLPVGLDGRVSHSHVERCIREHMEAIDFLRCDQAWLKETLGNMLARTDVDHGPIHQGNGATEAMQARSAYLC